MKEHPPWGPVRQHESGAQLFTKSPLGENAAVLAESSGERPHRHAVELASRRWRGGQIPQGRRRAATNLIEALGLTSGILKSILGACSNQPVSPVHRDNLFYALLLAENDGISTFGASGILKDGASGACAHIDR